jgi:hypothetical protein
MIKTLQEQRNKLMTDAAVILRNENPAQDQLDAANQMLADATALEQRIAALKQIEQHETEQREFVPAGRVPTDPTATEQRTGHQWNQVIVLAGHQIEAIDAVFLDGRKVIFQNGGFGEQVAVAALNGQTESRYCYDWAYDTSTSG